MKIEWQPDDVQAGRRVGHPERSEQWIVGYEASMSSRKAFNSMQTARKNNDDR